jgi:homoserine dehydrogenase
MRQLRLSIAGFGTVGRWLAAALHRRRAWIESECDTAVKVVGVATRRDGFIYRADGLDLGALLDRASGGQSLACHPGTRHWATAFDGLAATESDVLAEASNTNPLEPEPALSHIRLALGRGMHVVTSSKGACAAAALDLSTLARQNRVQFRMEATVMSGTPVLSTIREGLAGARVIALRGILNATANHILTRMAEGFDYGAALADAQTLGYAEPDPSADVDGHDVVAKARILAAVAFGQAITLDDVVRRGIAEIASDAVQSAERNGCRLKLVASMRSELVGTCNGSRQLDVRVEPVALPLTDPLARIDGVMNGLVMETDPVNEITIIGPGAGPHQAGQGVFADLISVLRRV